MNKEARKKKGRPVLEIIDRKRNDEKKKGRNNSDKYDRPKGEGNDQNKKQETPCLGMGGLASQIYYEHNGRESFLSAQDPKIDIPIFFVASGCYVARLGKPY